MPQCDKSKDMLMWEEKFPQHAQEIMEILDPFYNPQLSFDIKDPMGDIKDICTKAIFWGRFNDVVIIKPADFLELDPQTINNVWSPLGMAILNKYAYQVENGIGHWFNDNFSKSDFMGYLKEKIDASLRVSLGVDHRQRFWDALQVDFSTSLGNSLDSCLFFACALIVSGKAEDFSHLLNLWRSGNIPLGFDRHNNLGILCSKYPHE